MTRESVSQDSDGFRGQLHGARKQGARSRGGGPTGPHRVPVTRLPRQAQGTLETGAAALTGDALAFGTNAGRGRGRVGQPTCPHPRGVWGRGVLSGAHTACAGGVTPGWAVTQNGRRCTEEVGCESVDSGRPAFLSPR